MKIGPPKVALITGAGSGLGRALALALAQKGIRLSVVDYSEVAGLETLRLIEEEYAKLGKQFNKPTSVFVMCDVSKPGEVVSAFEQHRATFGRLDICINCAGTSEKQQFTDDTSKNGTGAWRQLVDVNLVAVIDCTRLAVQYMLESGCDGAILNVGSAAGLYPMYDGPVYSATKGGVVLFSRSLRVLAKKKIRVNVICPEYIGTQMTSSLNKKVVEASGGFISMEAFLQGAFELLEDDNKAGACLWITNRRGSEYWPSPEEKKKYALKSVPSRKSVLKQSTVALPKDYKKLTVHTLTNKFREATKIVSVPLNPVRRGHVLVKYAFAGVNASDVNFSAGHYFKSRQEALSRIPFDAGLEGVGIVAAIGEGVNRADLYVGAPVATLRFGCFAEFSEVPSSHAILVPAATPAVVSMLTSGLTALLGLEQAGKMRTGETVLITAAAGGTGQFAVQLAKLAGNKVVATCGGAAKASLLEKLGADRVINYQKEVVSEVLKKEFPKGVDLVYESVGGDMFQTCLNALGMFGRLVIIGMISQYQSGEVWEQSVHPAICEKLLSKSQTIVGFFLIHHVNKWHEALQRLCNLYNEGKLQVAVDSTPFSGLEAIADAVDHLLSGQSIGKIVVQIQPQDSLWRHSRL